jgi:hypothetical protein
MRILFVCAWLLVPVAFGFYHAGPGQDRLRLDDAGKLLKQGDEHAANAEWADAIAAFDEALKLLPPEKVEAARRIRLAQAKAQMQHEGLLTARAELQSLCDEVQADPGASPQLLAEVRSAKAQSHYYMTWLMRMEGVSRDEWEPEVETARQTYRLLAEQAAERGDAEAQRTHLEDLEATVRLARMEVGELQGLPLPKQCSGCCSGKKPSKSPKKAAGKPGPKKPKDARGASSGPPPDTGGH